MWAKLGIWSKSAKQGVSRSVMFSLQSKWVFSALCLPATTNNNNTTNNSNTTNNNNTRRQGRKFIQFAFNSFPEYLPSSWCPIFKFEEILRWVALASLFWLNWLRHVTWTTWTAEAIIRHERLVTLIESSRLVMLFTQAKLCWVNVTSVTWVGIFSPTQIGKILSPIQYIEDLIIIWENFDPTFANKKCSWAKFHCCMWPKLKT